MIEFDFELWARLALEDPATFESLRKQCIEHEINKVASSRRHRLTGLQFQIDMKRKLARTKLGGCIKISEMMMNHFYDKFKPSLDSLFYNDTINKEDAIQSKASVISLYSNKHR